MFKFHLRTERQANQSTIYGKGLSGEKIKKLINDFKKRAQDALFFISIKKIRISYPSQSKNHPELWAIEKSVVDPTGFDGVVKIHPTTLPPKHWSVLFNTIPLKEIPCEFHGCLSNHKIQTVSVGIAGAIDAPPPHHRPFFGIPLLDTISLPVHLHCTFILSDDRRSIRYDEEGNGNPESRFNKWLLTKKVSFFYLQFLSRWKSDYPMKKCPWWPKRPTSDRISRVVVEAMDNILPTSGELVCDTYSNSRIAPSKAHFLQPLCPSNLLKALFQVPEDLAIIPPGFTIQSSPSLQQVDSNYLTTVLRSEAGSIISAYKEGRITVDDVVDVAKFLKLSSLPNSLGLPLLPLADKSLALLSADHTTFYHPPQEPKSPQLPFPLHHFLDPQAAKEHTIYDSLQVRKLDNLAISTLIKAKIPEQDSFPSSPELESWFKELWSLLNAIPTFTIEDDAFQRLPLIPTHSPTTPTRISLQKLAGSEVLFVESHVTNVPFGPCITLGMRFILARKCQLKKLKDAIKSRKGAQSKIHRAIIKFFMDLAPEDIPNRFRKLNHELHSKFSQWFLEQLGNSYHALPGAEKGIVQLLPLWEAVHWVSSTPRFVSASEAVVIPKNINPDAVRAWATRSTAYIRPDNLLSPMKEPLTLPIFYQDHLRFPSVMNTVTPTYKSLLMEVLRSPPSPLPILVPNINGKMTPPSGLYLSSNPTFTAAFASQNELFLHRELRGLERQLCNWGLIYTLTTSSFKACASAIDQDINSAGILSRALTVFRSYNTEMPPVLMGDRNSRNALRDLRFIPRRTGDTRYGTIPTDRYYTLPNVVSPSKIVDPEFLRIAWTQRATCLEEPSSELRSVNKLDSVWEPTSREVVRITFFTLHSPH